MEVELRYEVTMRRGDVAVTHGETIRTSGTVSAQERDAMIRRCERMAANGLEDHRRWMETHGSIEEAEAEAAAMVAPY